MDRLIVLDFDHTVVEDNTDTFVMKLGEDGQIPGQVKAFYQQGNWTAFMNKVFEYLRDERGVTKFEYQRFLETMPLTANMIDLFHFIRCQKERTDCIIISDSNSWFIDVILAKCEFSDVPREVFTNPGYFESNGLLKVTPHHEHNHESCPINLCKGRVLKQFLAAQQKVGKMYDCVCYVGDGGNDLCPAMTLNSSDVLFVRKGFALHKKIDTSSELQRDNGLKCNVIVWENGLEIISGLEDLKQT